MIKFLRVYLKINNKIIIKKKMYKFMMVNKSMKNINAWNVNIKI